MPACLCSSHSVIVCCFEVINGWLLERPACKLPFKHYGYAETSTSLNIIFSSYSGVVRISHYIMRYSSVELLLYVTDNAVTNESRLVAVTVEVIY